MRLVFSILFSIVFTAGLTYSLWRWTNFIPWYFRNVRWVFSLACLVYIVGAIQNLDFFPWIAGAAYFGMMTIISWRNHADRDDDG